VKEQADLMPCLKHNNTTKEHMLNEHDLATFERLPVQLLYKLPRQSYFTFDDVAYYFDHVDGMYSLCRTLPSNDIIHFGASTPVVPLKAPQ
jgi:hypothetical protein